MPEPFFLPANLLLMYSVYIVGTASPGPSNLTIMAVGMDHGRRAAMVLAAGVITGSMFWGLLAGFGLAAVMATWGHALLVLKIVGGLYLLWLAYRAGRSAWSASAASQKRLGHPLTSPSRLYMQGAAMHLTNPKAILSWVATISVGLPVDAATGDVLIALSGCFALGILIFGGYALVFSTAAAQRTYRAARRWLEGALAAMYAYAGFRLLFSRS